MYQNRNGRPPVPLSRRTSTFSASTSDALKPTAPLTIVSGTVILRELFSFGPLKILTGTEWTSPVAINNLAYRGRNGCSYCGFCSSHSCPIGAKGDLAVAAIPSALRTGRLDLRPDSYVYRVELDGRGRALDNVFVQDDQVPYLHHHFEPTLFSEHLARMRYLPFYRIPYYRFIGRKPTTDGP